MLLSTLRLAFRNTLRNRRRSLVAVSTIGFGVVALLLAGGFIEWIFWAMREAAIQGGVGHVQIVRRGYEDAGAGNRFAYLLPAASPDLQLIERSAHVKAVTPRLNFDGLISHGDATLPFIAEGVDPVSEKRVSRVVQTAAGTALDPTDIEGVTLGVGLAADLGVQPGDKVVLLSTSASGAISGADAHVRGLFRTEAKAYDDSALRMNIGLARRLLKVEGSHAWVVALDDTARTRSWIDDVQRRLGNARLAFVPWFDLTDFYNKSVSLLSRQMQVVQFIIGMIIVLSISNMLTMTVLERTGEIGTLMAMGTTRGRVLLQFLWEGALLGTAGVAAGTLAGLLLSHAISYVGIPMPPPPGRSAGYSAEIMLTWPLAVKVMGLALASTTIAAVYPAWRASRLDIVDALRRNR